MVKSKTSSRSVRTPARKNGKQQRAKARAKSEETAVASFVNRVVDKHIADMRAGAIPSATTKTLESDRTIPPHCKLLSPARPEEGFCPKRWDHAFAVYPVGSAGLPERMASFITEDQWRQAEDLLCAGYVLGCNAHPDDAPDIACDVAQRCDFAVAAVYDGGEEVCYFVRRDEA